jgi:hypothetical protein
MSSTRHNRIIKTENTPFCGTCKNAGRPYSEYTSHFTKSVPGAHGIVTCPLILNSVCGQCKQRGHFTNFCTNSFVSDSSTTSQNPRWQKPAAASASDTLPPSWKKHPVIAAEPTSDFKRVKLNSSAATASTNVFDALADEEPVKKTKTNIVDEFPALVPVKKAQPTAWVTDHKFDPTEALKLPTVRIELVLHMPVLHRENTVIDYDDSVDYVAPNYWSGQKAMSGSWADYCDEDEEDY